MDPKSNKIFANIWIFFGFVGLVINPNPVAPVIFCVGGVILHAIADVQKHLLGSEEEDESNKG